MFSTSPISRFRHRLGLAIIFCCIAASVFAGSDDGGPDGYPRTFRPRILMTSRAPFWKVGTEDANLSALCATHHFNEFDERLRILYYGPIGAGYTGVAQKGFNLKDAYGIAKEGKTYHFYSDGTHYCRVFVAGDQPPARTIEQK